MFIKVRVRFRELEKEHAVPWDQQRWDSVTYPSTHARARGRSRVELREEEGTLSYPRSCDLQ